MSEEEAHASEEEAAAAEENVAAEEEAAVVEPEEAPSGLHVLYTASELDNLFSGALIGRLAAMMAEGDKGVAKVEKIVIVDWPRGKHGHKSIENLPEGVEVLVVDDVAAEAYKEAVVAADVVISSCNGHVVETRQALETLLDADYENRKTFIGVSSVLSWARTPMQPDEVLCEEDYVRRLGHPNYSELQDLEKRIARAQDDYLRSHVLCAGALYGLGEELFYDAFKECWEGAAAPMPLLPSEGANVLPTVHVDDLVSMVGRLLLPTTCPLVAEQTRHMLAVDNGRNSLIDILGKMSQHMSTGEVVTLSEDDTLLLSNNDFLAIHQVMEPAAADILMDGHWKSREGLVANIDSVVEQFKAAQGLAQCRLIVNGPPLSGKTRLAEELSSYYSVPVIDVQEAIKEAAGMPEESWASPEWGQLITGEEEERKVLDVKDVPPEALRSVLHWKLGLQEYACRGWVLDNFPLTNTQAKAVFAVPPPEVPDGEDPPEVDPEAVPVLEAGFCPTNVISLECDDEAITTRWESIEEGERSPEYADEETFQATLAAYRALEAGEAAEPTGKPAKGAAPIEVDMLAARLWEKALPEGAFLSMAPGSWPDTSQAMREAIGAPTNFLGPGHLLSDDWVEPVEEVIVETPLPVPPRIAEIRKQKADELADKSSQDEIAENRALYEGATPLREHLLDVAMPAVTEALVLACEEQPKDPIAFVCKFLFDYEERDNRTKVAKSREIKAKAKADIVKKKEEEDKAKREGKQKSK